MGFYGDSGFGFSVPVGDFQGRTFITDSTGTSKGPEADNNKRSSASGVIIGQAGSGVSITSLPNHQSTLNMRFTNDSAVTTQNGLLFIYDRVNKNNDPSGVTVYTAEIIHPDIVQNPNGSGDALWVQTAGSGVTLSMSDSPGESGLSPMGPSTSDVRHDWYVAISVSPNSVGSKEFAGHFELEFL